MMRVARTAFCAACLTAIVSSSIAAQNVNLPDDVLNALVRGPGVALTDTYTVLADTPPGFPRELLPPGAEVRGAAISGSVTAVIAVLAKSDVPRTNDITRLTTLGWVNTGMPASGFASLPVSQPTTVCRGTDFAYIATSPRPDGSSFVRISLPKSAGRPCVSRPVLGMEAFNIPVLTLVPGAKQIGGSGGGGGTDNWYTATRIQTDRSADDIRDHYVKQLIAAGWKVEGKHLHDDTMAVTHLSSTQGEPATAVLIIIELKDNVRDVMLRAVRNVTQQQPRMNPVTMNPVPPSRE